MERALKAIAARLPKRWQQELKRVHFASQLRRGRFRTSEPDYALLPSLVGVRNNPDGKRLQDVVPADVYLRWLALKSRYIGKDDKVERWRPLFAAGELYRKAIDEAGLERSTVVWNSVRKLARRQGLRITTPEVEVKVERARATVEEFKREPLDDVDCFARMIGFLESDLELLRERAHAWQDPDELFRVDSWTHVLLGQGITPGQPHPLARALADDDLRKLLASIRQPIDHAVAQMPSQQAFIDRYCKAGAEVWGSRPVSA